MAVSTGVMRGQLLDQELSKSVAGTGTLNLAADEARNRSIELTGALTGARTVVFPVIADDAGKAWLVKNASTGAFSLTVKGPTGTGVVVSQGEAQYLLWNGDDFEGAISQIPQAYLSVPGTVFPVEAQGAVGDGTTDDAAAINAAIAAAVAAGGGVVTLNAGTFIVGAVIEMFDSTILQGAGKERTTIKLKDATNGAFDIITNDDLVAGNDNFAVRGLKVDGNHANNLTHVGSCIHFVNSRDWEVADCHATGGNSAGGGTKGYGIGCEGTLTERFRIVRNTATGNQRHGIATTSTPKYGTIDHNISYANTLEGIHTSTGEYLSVSHNVVYSNDSEGIGLTNAVQVSCVGNVVFDNLNGIAGVIGGKAIIGNQIRENTQSGISLIATSNAVARCSILGNGLRANGEHQIEIQKPSRLTISGNAITETTNNFHGIMLSVLPTGGEPNRGVVITGNVVEGPASGGVSLRVDTAAFVGMVIKGNHFQVAPTFAGVPTGSIIRDNIGFVTENKGTATILNTTTTIAVTHGLGLTPTLGDISVNLNESIGTGGHFWIADPTATDFDIHTNADPGTDVTFSWSARII